MRRSTTPIIFGFLLLMVAFVYLAQAAFIVQLIGVVDRVEGKAEVQRQGKGRWIPLKEEMYVQTEDLVHTATKSRAEIRWLDGTRMRIEPDTTLQITKSTMNTLNKAKRSEYKLEIGKVWIRIIEALSPESKFEITTPTSTAAVRGTIFSVEVQQDGTTAVSVYDGNVTLATGNQKTTVGEGATALSASPVAVPQVADQSREEQTQWQQQTGIITPPLNVRSPLDNETVTAPQLQIRGTVERTATLTVNGVPIKRRLKAKDQFDYAVQLEPGENEIRIVATDAKGTATVILRKVTLKTAGTPEVQPVAPATPPAVTPLPQSSNPSPQEAPAPAQPATGGKVEGNTTQPTTE